jgi:hypothetical protein|tara:strand:- start:31 stop:642 length:612 start_codon:yes stop_codon:yes gene_type:complete
MATYQDSRYNIALPSGSGGALVLIKTLTASSSGTLSFVNGASDVVLDSTYRTYIFKFINIHPGTAETELTFNMSVDTGSNYNVTKTTTFFRANHREDDGGTPGFGYRTGDDLAQSTNFQALSAVNGAGNDEALSGYLYLFNPSSTTFTKHFIGESNAYMINQDHTNHSLFAGYGNTTSAVDAVQFKMSSGNMDVGTIKMYGIA